MDNAFAQDEKKALVFLKKNVIASLAVALVLGGVLGYGAAPLGSGTRGSANGFAAGTMRGAPAGFTGGTGAFARRAGNGMLAGTVLAKDANSITLDSRDGSSHVVLMTPSTVFSKSVSGSLADVRVGSSVLITGTANPDGSTLAQSVTLRGATDAAGMPAPAR